jgi:hypothetical protein
MSRLKRQIEALSVKLVGGCVFERGQHMGFSAELSMVGIHLSPVQAESDRRASAMEEERSAPSFSIPDSSLFICFQFTNIFQGCI